MLNVNEMIEDIKNEIIDYIKIHKNTDYLNTPGLLKALDIIKKYENNFSIWEYIINIVDKNKKNGV